MSFQDKTKGLAAALRLDSHHAIERFGVFFALIVVAFAVLLTGATSSALANQREAMDSTTLYTPSFTTSRTQLAGDVNGVYVSSDRTRAMVLMKFDDAKSISSDAGKYQAYLTGATPELESEPLKNDITGEIVVFGSSGYMAMILNSETPFEQQILNLTLRANSELVYQPSDRRKVREDLANQKSFAEFDQWRLYFNAAASGAEVTKALDGEDIDSGAIFDELVIADQEAELRAQMEEQLAQMQTDLARIAEYESDARRVNVDGIYLEVPETPAQIAGDRITGEPAIDGKPSTLELHTDWVSPRGFDFDWRSGSVAEGYLDELLPDGESYVSWLAEKSSQKRDDQPEGFKASQIEWTLSNGQLLSDYRSNDTVMQPLMEIRNNLSQAYDDYYKHKLEYQIDSHANLIDLEIELRNVVSGASVNDSTEALFIY